MFILFKVRKIFLRIFYAFISVILISIIIIIICVIDSYPSVS